MSKNNSRRSAPSYASGIKRIRSGALSESHLSTRLQASALTFPSPSATLSHTTSSLLPGLIYGECKSNPPVVSRGGAITSVAGVIPAGDYLVSQLDFFAVHIQPEDSWYILPARIVCPHRYLYLLRTASKANGLLAYRGSAAHQFEPYREAWHLLQAK